MAKVETRIEKAAGATKPDKAETRNRTFEYAWTLKKQGYSEATIKTYKYDLENLIQKGANLNNSETVKETLARSNWSQTYKNVIIAAYTFWLKMHGETWEPPFCKPCRKLPFIPTEQELDSLIAGCGRKTSAFLQLLKETAMRLGEASKIRWFDVDLQRKIVVLNTPEKNGNPRIFQISSKLVAMLSTLPKTTEYVFGTSYKIARSTCLYKERKRVAAKLGNPRLKRISCHTFRHWKATMLYHETRDILLVKEFLGHKSIDTTLLYIQLEKALFQTTSDEFTVKATRDPEEIKALLEVGFGYVCEKEGLMFFKKRK